MKKTAEFEILKLMETTATHTKLQKLTESAIGTTALVAGRIAQAATKPVTGAIGKALYGETPTGLMALNIPMVVPSSIDKATAMKLGFIQQARISELFLASLGAAIANSKFSSTNAVIKKFMEENEDYVTTLSLVAKKIEKLQESEKASNGQNFDGQSDFTSRRQSTGIAKSPYTFMNFSFDRRSSVIPMAASLGFGNVDKIQLKVGLRVYSIFEDDKTLANELIKVFERKDKFDSLYKRIKNMDRNEVSILDVLKGKDIKLRREKQSIDLSSKDLSLVLSKVLVQDKSWLSSLEKTKIGGAIVLTKEIVDYLDNAGFNITEPHIAKQFMVYSKTYDLYIVDQEMDKLYLLDKLSFTFTPHSLSSLIDASKAVIRRAEISFS